MRLIGMVECRVCIRWYITAHSMVGETYSSLSESSRWRDEVVRVIA